MTDRDAQPPRELAEAELVRAAGGTTGAFKVPDVTLKRGVID